MPARYSATRLSCPECNSIKTVLTSEHLGEHSHLCADCDHLWTIAPVIRRALLVTARPSAAARDSMLTRAAKVRRAAALNGKRAKYKNR
jgi:hypothetical protein